MWLLSNFSGLDLGVDIPRVCVWTWTYLPAETASWTQRGCCSLRRICRRSGRAEKWGPGTAPWQWLFRNTVSSTVCHTDIPRQDSLSHCSQDTMASQPGQNTPFTKVPNSYTYDDRKHKFTDQPSTIRQLNKCLHKLLLNSQTLHYKN